jgi:HAD superfamily phosphatase (TIGR01668 family)
MLKKKYIPFATAPSLYDVSPSFWKSLGIKALIADLDNTLDGFKVMTPSATALAYKKQLDEAGIQLIIASNNTAHRVAPYAEKIGVKAAFWLLKPLGFRLRKFLQKHHLEKDQVVFVGDQVMTDVLACHKAGVRCLLVEPLTKKDSFLSFFNRRYERRIRLRIKEGHLAPSWEELV